jgi:pilus assembly protein CpaF
MMADGGMLQRQINDSLAPLQSLFCDPKVTDIAIKGYDGVYVRRHGSGFEHHRVAWTSDDEILMACRQLARFMGRPLDNENPMLDCRLPDKSRVNIVINPVYRGKVFLSIRRFPETSFDLEDLVRLDSLSEESAQILKGLIQQGKNIMISGGTASGKTTLLNALAKCIPDDDVIVTVEDSMEINLGNKPLWIAMETKASTYEGGNEVGLKELVKNSLRMSPKWIIVGEVRGAEVFDMIRAFNTGHSGMATVHANDAISALYAIEMIYQQFVKVENLMALRRSIMSTINCVVQTSFDKVQGRKVREILLVNKEGEEYSGEYIFKR